MAITPPLPNAFESSRELSLIACFSFYHLEWDPEKEVNDSTIYFTSTRY
jgi:hypothetical protein